MFTNGFAELLKLNSIYAVFTNTLLVSIPEEVFLIALSLMLSGNIRLLENKLQVIITAVPAALISNILRASGVDINIVFFITCLIISLTISVSYRIRNSKMIIRLFLALLLGIVILLILEMSYMPIFFYITGKTMADFNRSILLNFVLSIPERTVEAFIIISVYSWWNSCERINFIDKITQSVKIMIFSIVMLAANVVFLLGAYTIVVGSNVLGNFSLTFKVVIALCIIMIPLTNIITFYAITYLLLSEEKNNQNYYESRLYMLLESLTRHFRRCDYKSAELILKNTKEEYIKKKERM